MKNTFYLLVILVVLAAEWACHQEKKVQQPTTQIDSAVVSPKPNALSNETMVATINAQVKDKKLTEKQVEVADESLEGGELVGYYQGKDLQKMLLTLYGETGKMEVDFYFNQKQLFRIMAKRSFYDKPIYEEGAKVERTITWKKDIPASIQVTKQTPNPDDMVFRYDQDTALQTWAQKASQLEAKLSTKP
ncbi:MAG: hypothetical protein U0Y10_25210 [Spirosomataceae bacterium]